MRLENPSIACNEIQLLATIEPVTSGALPAFFGGDSALYTVTVKNPGGAEVAMQLFDENVARQAGALRRQPE